MLQQPVPEMNVHTRDEKKLDCSGLVLPSCQYLINDVYLYAFLHSFETQSAFTVTVPFVHMCILTDQWLPNWYQCIGVMWSLVSCPSTCEVDHFALQLPS